MLGWRNWRKTHHDFLNWLIECFFCFLNPGKIFTKQTKQIIKIFEGFYMPDQKKTAKNQREISTFSVIGNWKYLVSGVFHFDERKSNPRHRWIFGVFPPDLSGIHPPNEPLLHESHSPFPVFFSPMFRTVVFRCFCCGPKIQTQQIWETSYSRATWTMPFSSFQNSLCEGLFLRGTPIRIPKQPT